MPLDPDSQAGVADAETETSAEQTTMRVKILFMIGSLGCWVKARLTEPLKQLLGAAMHPETGRPKSHSRVRKVLEGCSKSAEGTPPKLQTHRPPAPVLSGRASASLRVGEHSETEEGIPVPIETSDDRDER